MRYDFLIVGAGMFGAVAARELTDKGYKCLVIDERDHIGGNCYSGDWNGIQVHEYGSHIFHTDLKEVWDYVNRFSEWNQYQHKTIVNYKGRFFSFPINLLTLQQVYGLSDKDALVRMFVDRKEAIENPKNMEEFCLSEIGKELYHIFVKEYNKKQWGKDPKDLPADFVKRIPIRTNFDDNYYNHPYQGMPKYGYEYFFRNLLHGIEVRLSTSYVDLANDVTPVLCREIIYTGAIDEFHDYKFGKLDYRSLDLQHSILHRQDYQGCAIMNFTGVEVPHTRIVEHKHFDRSQKTEHTVITKEFPQQYVEGKNLRYYPVTDNKNKKLYDRYYRHAMYETPRIHFKGRLGEYKYYDMDKTIASALGFVKGYKKR